MLVDRPLTATNDRQQPSAQGAGRTQKVARGRQSGGAQFRGVRMPRTNVLRLKMLQLGVDREPLLGGHRGGSQLRFSAARTAAGDARQTQRARDAKSGDAKF